MMLLDEFEDGGREFVFEVAPGDEEAARSVAEAAREEWHTENDVADVCLEQHILRRLINAGYVE